MQKSTDSPYFAAVDLGSNSFHMIIARIQNRQLDIVDREKEMVQLARGIKPGGHISAAAQTRAIECLQRFAERLRDIPASQIRAVGTKTLRSSKKSKAFLRQAEQVLGVPIQVISGYEEARLVYTGLAHSVRDDRKRRLVVDIGGGSTELIIGQEYEPLLMESLSMGCVSFTEKFLEKSGGRINSKFMQKAYLAACTRLEALRNNYVQAGWEIVYGTSGTVRTIADLTQAKDGGAVITKASLNELADRLIDKKTELPELPQLRRSVLPAGVAILQAVFDQLGINVMHVGDASLKEGLLYDTIGRLSNEDSRQKTIVALQKQYKVDRVHAQRVADTALHFWKQIDGPPLPGVSRTKILAWAAQIHEVGLSISHSAYHHHGYYIIRHNDMAGFGRYEQYILANLVRSHRKALDDEKIVDMDEVAATAFIPLLMCLRLAVLLHRRRDDLQQLPNLSVQDAGYSLQFVSGWLEDNPLTFAGLQQEQGYWEKIGIELILS